MKTVNFRTLEKAEFRLRKECSGSDIEIVRRGDGIDTAIYYCLAFPGKTISTIETCRFINELSRIVNIVDNFEYNGYFVDWNDNF